MMYLSQMSRLTHAAKSELHVQQIRNYSGYKPKCYLFKLTKWYFGHLEGFESLPK